MFTRIAWNIRARGPEHVAPECLRRIAPAGRRGCDDLGIPPRDFDKMTRSLFDRQD